MKFTVESGKYSKDIHNAESHAAAAEAFLALIAASDPSPDFGKVISVSSSLATNYFCTSTLLLALKPRSHLRLVE